MSPLTQGLNYRSACDISCNHVFHKTDSWCMPAPCTVVLLQFYCRSGYESARAPKGSAHSRLNVIVSREVICDLSVLKIAKTLLAGHDFPASLPHSSRIRVYVFFENKKTRLFTFFLQRHLKKRKKT